MTNTTRRLAALCLMFGIAFGAASPAAAQSWQCAPFARLVSGLQLFGAAASWWNQAIGKYARGESPKIGSVLVFKAVGAMRSGHVATVSQIVSDRIIKVTHANWSVINGHRGQVERDVTVVDASEKGDWSKVRVWYKPINDVGIKSYPVYGFIYAGAQAAAAAIEAPRLALESASF
ncbi:CHAP domain-containing protein [Sphingomonas quercus]|uniref:CHAP domain-containing protein n=1 Tax=Sphingomonas quercus TaxID=2842451 RepID=A0ABS6BLG9_9SPHN|nr:CHAP domain-containing protein [Sphingomonas quercus]MBU3078070.1 CHAP domain-containing protein [Sphingomonas quercus]